MAKLGIRFDGSGLDDLPSKVLQALSEGRFSLETETERVTPDEGDFVTLRVVARRLVIEIDEPSTPPQGR